MKLSDLISVLNADNIIRVMLGDNSIFEGLNRYAFDLPDIYQNMKVIYLYITPFKELKIEISEED